MDVVERGTVKLPFVKVWVSWRNSFHLCPMRCLVWKLPYFRCHATQHWSTTMNGHKCVCVCVCSWFAVFHDKWERTRPVIVEILLLCHLLWVRMDVPSRGGGDGSMHLADFWWKVKMVSVTLLWSRQHQPGTHSPIPRCLTAFRCDYGAGLRFFTLTWMKTTAVWSYGFFLPIPIFRKTKITECISDQCSNGPWPPHDRCMVIDLARLRRRGASISRHGCTVMS